MHGSVQGAPCEQVRTGSLEFAGTRPAQDKIQPPFFDKPVHLVQQVRQTLDFIHDDPLTGWNRTQFISKLTGMGQQPLIYLLRQQVDPVGFGE